MPRIEIEVNDKTWEMWRQFQGTMQAAGLRESGLLGEWMVHGFLNNLHIYLREGGPKPAESPRRRRDRLANDARKKLIKQQKRVLPMFNENDSILLSEMSRVLGLDQEAGAELLSHWLEEGFLSPAAPRDGQDAYTLGEDWQKRNLAANRPSLNAPRAVFRADAALEDK